jgi:hypothetical protein
MPARIAMRQLEAITGLLGDKTVGHNLGEPTACKDLPELVPDLKFLVLRVCHHVGQRLGGRNLIITPQASHFLHQVLRALEVYTKGWGHHPETILVQRGYVQLYRCQIGANLVLAHDHT